MENELSKALRFCGAGKEPCSKCPFWQRLDPADCQIEIMLKAADELDRLTAGKEKTNADTKSTGDPEI